MFVAPIGGKKKKGSKPNRESATKQAEELASGNENAATNVDGLIGGEGSGRCGENASAILMSRIQKAKQERAVLSTEKPRKPVFMCLIRGIAARATGQNGDLAMTSDLIHVRT